MKKMLRINILVVMIFALLASIALPQGEASVTQRINLHIDGGYVDKNTQVTIVYKKDKNDHHLKLTRKNGNLYSEAKPNSFRPTLDIKVLVKTTKETKTYYPFKIVSNNGNLNYWVAYKKPAANVKTLKTFTLNKPLIPFVKDIYYNGNGTFTAYWGYENQNHVVVDARYSRFTKVAKLYNNATAKTKGFAEGKVEEAFKTVFAGSSVTWELTGPDGVKRKATAYASKAKTYGTVQPLLKGVYKNLNGTFTAYWGYNNTNSLTVDAKLSQFSTLALNNEQPKKVNFLPGQVDEAFTTTFNSPSLAWNLTGPNGVASTVTAETVNAKAYGAVQPTVKAVYDNGNGTFTAYWGYQNQNDVTVNAMDSKFISGTVLNGAQPKKKGFLKGTNDQAFATVFKGTHVTWELTGPNGEKRTVTANSVGALKYTALQPIVEKVVNNGNGTFTVIWGYNNQNNVEVKARQSVFFKGTILKTEAAKKDGFKPGLQSNVFETTFRGTELSWEVKGPDGVVRTVTAFAKDAVAR